MPGPFPQDFKIIVFGENLPEHNLYKTIFHCSNKREFELLLNKYSSSILIIACQNEILIEMASILQKFVNINKIYILTDEHDILWPLELEESKSNFQWTRLDDRNKLMRHLLTEAVFHYVQKGDEYKSIGNHGLANLCFQDAINALNQNSLVI